MKTLSIHQLERLQGSSKGKSLPFPIPMPGPNDPICGVFSAFSLVTLGGVGSAGLTISKPYCDQLYGPF